MPLLQPERYFSRTSAINIEADLLGQGFTHALLDIDNTIVSRADHLVPKDVRHWLVRAKDAGVELCFLSNNWHKSVHEMAADIGIPVVAKACKPLPHGFFMARCKIGGKRSNTLMIGDQLSTDVLGAHLAGLKAYLVCPLAEEDLKHTVLVRNIERAFIADREPEGAVFTEAQRR